MEKVLVTGVGGILGNALARVAARESRRVLLSGRTTSSSADVLALDICDGRAVDRVVRTERVDAIINCAGLTKARCHDASEAMWVNAAGPRILSSVANWRGVRLVHVSTDCVFDGQAGPYAEADAPNATDLYGRSKALGESTGPGSLVVRTSFIGWEGVGGHGLLAWLVGQRGQVHGFEDHLWSGLCAPALARVLLDVAGRRDVVGLLHVAGEHMSKASLLEQLAVALDLEVEVVRRRSGSPVDRRLRSTRMEALALNIPSMGEMIEELKRERPR